MVVSVNLPAWVEQGYKSQQAYDDRNKPKLDNWVFPSPLPIDFSNPNNEPVAFADLPDDEYKNLQRGNFGKLEKQPEIIRKNFVDIGKAVPKAPQPAVPPGFTPSTGGFAVMTPYYNKYTGKTYSTTDSGYQPLPDSGWTKGNLPSNFKPQKRPQMATNPTPTDGATALSVDKRNAPIIDIMGRQAVGPALPPGSSFVGAGQVAQANEFVDPTTSQVTPTAPAATVSQAPAPTLVTKPTTLTTPQVTSTAVDSAFGTMDAATQAAPTQTMADITGTVSTGAIPQAAVQDMDEQATVQYQLSELYKTIESGKPLPAWAAGPARAASQIMQQRGLGSSSMAAAAIAQNVMEGAMPIAAADAQSYQRLQLTNLNNEQAAALQKAAMYAGMDTANLSSRLTSSVNNAKNFLSIDLANLSAKQSANTVSYNAKVQGMFTDQAQENATQQFNAKNNIQVEEFFAQLGTQVDEANANRTAAVNQFNTGQNNALSQFNSTLQDSRDKFNSNMRAQIDQSNAQWRRQINTANTATQNEVNRTNAQALLGLSAAAQNNLWQSYRDEAAWLVQVTERAIDRAHQIAVVAQKANIAEDLQYADNMGSAIGAIGAIAFERLFPAKS